VIILIIYTIKIIIPGHFLEAIIYPKLFVTSFLFSPIHGHPSFLVSILAFIIPLGFYLNYTLKKINSYIMILGVALAITCTYISGARIGVIIDLCLLTLSMIFYRKELNAKVKIAGLMCGVAIVTLTIFNTNKFSSDPVRSELFRVGIETIKKNPWKGSGIESMRKYISNAEFNIADEYAKEHYLHSHFHNQLIDEIVQFGIPAGIIFILFWICCLKTAIQRKDYLLYSFIAIYILFINVDSPMGAAKGLVPMLFWLCLIFSTQHIRLQPNNKIKNYLKNHDKIKEIAISRTDSIGDVILTLPMAGLLKELFPSSRITFIGKTYTKNIIECSKHVDRFIAWDSLKNKDEQLSMMKQLSLDCIIHVFPNKEIAFSAKKAKIPVRIGTSSRIFHWFTCNKLVRLSRRKSLLHEAQLNLKLAQSLGANKFYSLAEIQKLLSFAPQEKISTVENVILPNKFNVVLHPKSKGSAREWGTHNFAQLIKLLPKERFSIFITGTQAEGDMVRENLITPLTDRIVDLTGKLTLPQLIKLLSEVDAIVAASTGPLHIGSALGINAIGIYPPIRPMHPGRWAPIGKLTKIFVAKKECNKCRKNATLCSCMAEVKPEQIAEYLISTAAKKVTQ
jgi:ADP-heptose:LPS heptosyltransferase